MKVPFLFFCKSYREDFDRLSILGGTDIISKVLNNISQSVLSIKNVD